MAIGMSLVEDGGSLTESDVAMVQTPDTNTSTC